MPNLGPIPWWIALPAAAIVQFWAWAILKIGGQPTPLPPGCSNDPEAEDQTIEEAEPVQRPPLPPAFLIRQQIDYVPAKADAEHL